MLTRTFYIFIIGVLLDYAGTYAAQVAFIKEEPYDEALEYRKWTKSFREIIRDSYNLLGGSCVYISENSDKSVI